jgi:signal transduction histidine kinase/CheY-like chemotaxis protein
MSSAVALSPTSADTDSVATGSARPDFQPTTLAAVSLEQAPMGMCWLDDEGRVVACNLAFAALTHCRREEQPLFTSFLPGGALPWTNRASADARAPVECELLTRDGVRVPVTLRNRRVQYGGRDLEMLLVEDVTELRKVQQHVATAQRLESVGVLAGGIAHNLNNTLASIILGLDFLRDKAGATQLPMLNNMLASAQRAAGLVTQMLMFAKRKEMKLEKLEAGRLLDELSRTLTHTFPKNIEVNIVPPRDLPPLLGDDVHLMRVLLNLALNARDAMPLGGRLEIRADLVIADHHHTAVVGTVRPGRYVRFSVADTGTGMPPEVRERIFDPFFTTKGPDKGTGLGLSDAHGIVESHRGFLNLYTEVGRGTRFHINIPAVGEEPRREATATAGPLNIEGRGRLALIADDEVMVRTVLHDVLERLGFTVLVANDGPEVLAHCALRKDKISLLILDLHMPKLDGLNLLRALRSICPAVPVVVISGRFLEDERRALDQLGSPQLLSKPFNQAALNACLHTVLAKA